MARLSAFQFTTLNGYFEGPEHDIGWHRHGGDEAQYSAEGLALGNILLFGRRTYEMMAGFWPTPEAAHAFPAVAEGMNRAEKVVFSRTLRRAEWCNTCVARGDMVSEIKALKEHSPRHLTLLGSGSVLAQLASEGLIDSYQIMVDPVALGAGTALFAGLTRPLNLNLTATRTFRSGVVLLSYEPAPGA